MILEHEWLSRERTKNPKRIWKGFVVKSPMTNRMLAAFASKKEAEDYVKKVQADPKKASLLPG